MKIFTHCDRCGEELPDNEKRMGSAFHEKCWKLDCEEAKAKSAKLSKVSYGK